MITICWALNEYNKLNLKFWKRLIEENKEAVWLFIDGSQENMDKIFILFKSIEATWKSQDKIKFVGKKREKMEESNNLIILNGNPQGFKVYYERFANPRKLVAFPKI